MILKLKKEMSKKDEDFENEIELLKQKIENKETENKKLRMVNNTQKQHINKLENDIKIHPIVNQVIQESADESDSDGENPKTEKRKPAVKKRPSRDSSKEKEKNSKRITDTGSSYPNEPTSSVANNKSEEDIIHNQDNKNATIPPPAKDLSELKATLIQFRTVLRISNVGVEEFLDLIVFKDKSSSIKFSDFKLRVQEIMKNYTHDFA